MAFTFTEMLSEFKNMENNEREDFLDWLYDEYFDIGLTPEKRQKISRIMSAYENGELIEVENRF